MESVPLLPLARQGERQSIVRMVEAHRELEASLTPANWAQMMMNLARG